jgi:hypothetical protein
MKFHTKALYNLLRLNSLEDPSIDVEKWQIEDLRSATLDEIFSKLNDLNIQFDRHTFTLYANNLESPEIMTELILTEADKIELYDRVYLLIFELWRRLLPEKQTLAIFCDELDHRIYQYDHYILDNDEIIQDVLANLIDILNENADFGVGPKDIFKGLIEYSAHDIEAFLYDYTCEQIDACNFAYASELIDGFYSYIEDSKPFNFLKARVAAKDDITRANELISSIIKELKKATDLDLQLEILRFMVQAGDRDLFVKLAKLTLDIIQIEEDFVELMEIVADFYRRLDQEDIEKSIQKIMKLRLTKKSIEKIDLKDPDIKKFKLTLN